MFNNPNAKCEQLAQEGQQIVTLQVYPASRLVEPFVKHWAAALSGTIDRAMSGSRRITVPNQTARDEEMAVPSGVGKKEQ
jgi:hypothetical protein